MLCRRRNSLRRKGQRLPQIVLPQRQCITQGSSRSMHHETFSRQLADFADKVFSIDRDLWDDWTPFFPQDGCTTEVNSNTLTVRSYPTSQVYGDLGMPLVLYEWEWESMNPDEALQLLRRNFFARDFFDDEGSFQLIEKLPASDTAPLRNHTICRWLWDRNPRPFFTEREWLEYYGVDLESKTLLSRSVIHPTVEEYDWTPMRKLIGSVIPTGTIRGEAFFATRLSPPRPGKKGCLYQSICWNSLGGLIDFVTPYLHPIRTAYIKGMIAQLARYEKFATESKAGQWPEVPFDLL